MFVGWRGYGLALLALVVSVWGLLLVQTALGQTTVALALVLLVVVIAVIAGRGPGLVTALGAGLSFNYFFIPPFHSFRIHRAEDVIAFVTLIVTAVIVGQLSRRVTATTAEAESLRRSEQLKSSLLDAVTHDLRTPLTSIKAAATTLQNAGLTQDAREELEEVIEQEADRLDHFISGMVDLAQIEAGAIHLHSRSTTAEEVIEDAVARAEPWLRSHEVRIDLAADLPTLRADPRLISQVLYSVLENAARYSAADTPIDITAQREPDAIVFSVTDRGRGIPAELRKKVFDKFFRAESSKGLGMGLAIARGIVQAHRGSIWIADIPAPGTQVSFRIPLEPMA